MPWRKPPYFPALIGKSTSSSASYTVGTVTQSERIEGQESTNMPNVAEKRRIFRKLHEAGCFVIPNPWNVGTARYLQHLGFKALATTSSGFAHSQGFADG